MKVFIQCLGGTILLFVLLIWSCSTSTDGEVMAASINMGDDTTPVNFSYVSTNVAKSVNETVNLVVDGQNFTVLVSDSGKHYLNKVSKSGTEYKKSYGYKTTYTLEGKTVWRSVKKPTGKSSYHVLVVRNGKLGKTKIQKN